jgi:probable HAF family extracellular repeat protein
MMAKLLKLCTVSAIRWETLALAVLLATSASYHPAVAQSFQGLGFLPGDTYSAAIAVNADGTVAVGTSSGTFGHAFRWTASGGMVGLGYLPGDNQSLAGAVNADGSVVVGYSSQYGGVSPQAVRWTGPSNLIGLGYLSGNNSSTAFGVSADGSVVVGNSYNEGNCCNNQAFRWTAAGGMVALGSVSGYPVSYAFGVNVDGSVVVGVSYVASLSQAQAFRWTSAGGMVELGYLMGGNNSFANAVNADGSVLVGGSTTANDAHNYEAFRWTQNGGMVGLGFLSGHNSSNAMAVNADGSVVVGCSGLNGNCDQAFLWTAVGGMKSVQALLTTQGVSTTGWTLTTARGVSADGLVIVGDGIDPNGRTQGWIAKLSPPPILQVSPTSNILASGIQGEAFSPASFQYQLSSTVASVNYAISVSPPAPWLNSSFTSGTATTSPVTVTFSLINPGSRGPGTYTTTISFTNTSNGQGNTTRTATLIVNAGTKDGCKDGGWKNYISFPGPFKNQGQCVSYFAQRH